MNNNPTFSDPLDELMNKHLAANGEEPITPTESVEIPLETSEDPNSEKPKIDFGDDDMEAEIAAEDAAREAAREAKRQAMQAARDEEAAKLKAMPPQPHDTEAQREEVDFQSDKLAIVTGMVNRVVAKYKLFTGGIPADIRMRVMGELVDLYHNQGELITPEFEATVVDNWVMEDGISGRQFVDSGSVISAPADEKKAEEVAAPAPDVAKVEINVPTNTPVTVNVDGETLQEVTNTRTLEIVVNEIDEKELRTATVIENSQIEGIIEAYDSGLNDVPVTLPASAYRAVLNSIAWLDFIKLVAPTSGTRADDELRKWSVLYKHIKNPSIGKFKDFEDFLKHTKYQDRELLMWGLLVATADEEENLSLTCANPKCRSRISLKYRPREIVHLDEEHIPKHYTAAHEASAGEEARKIHDESANKIKRYRLPDSGVIVDIKEPSAYDFINKKLPLFTELFERFVPDGDMSDLDVNDPAMAEFDYLSANALYIEAMAIVKDGKEYRYTLWEDIEKILTKAISTDDSAVLLKIIQESRSNTSPVSFRISNITCPLCKHHEDYINITDIGNTLLFQVSRRLDNTQIKLKEMELN